MAFGFLITCKVCNFSFDLPSPPYIPDKNMLEVNLLFFSACMAGGLGRQGMNSFLSPFCQKKRKQLKERKSVKSMEKVYQSETELQAGKGVHQEKRKRKEGGEVGGGAPPQKKRQILCSRCHQPNHNKRTCPLPPAKLD